MSIDRDAVRQTVSVVPEAGRQLALQVRKCQKFSLLFQAGTPSAGGCAAASAAGRDLRSRCRTALRTRLPSDQCLAPAGYPDGIPGNSVIDHDGRG